MEPKFAIQVNHLTKTFGQQTAVDDVSFSVQRGEVFGLLGPNGAGKTTILRMLTTLLTPSAGNVTIFGRDNQQDGAAARSLFGVTGQYASLDEDLSARENLMIFSRLNGLSRRAARERTAQLLTEFSLEQSADKALAAFSGGMRRRLDLAVSLITRPALIFLDEPTTGLDPRTRNQLWATIRRLVQQGSTIFLTTQYLEEADTLADRVAVIDHGKLVRLGTPAELKRAAGASTLSLKVAPEAVASATQILTAALNAHPQATGPTLVTAFKRPAQVTAGLMALQQAHITITDLTVQGPSLDDVFMALTVGKN